MQKGDFPGRVANASQTVGAFNDLRLNGNSRGPANESSRVSRGARLANGRVTRSDNAEARKRPQTGVDYRPK